MHRIVPENAGPGELDCVAACRAADLTVPAEVAGIFAGCDAVVHLAAIPSPDASYEDVWANNMRADGLVNPALACSPRNARAIHARSGEHPHAHNVCTPARDKAPLGLRGAGHRLADVRGV